MKIKNGEHLNFNEPGNSLGCHQLTFSFFKLLCLTLLSFSIFSGPNFGKTAETDKEGYELISKFIYSTAWRTLQKD